MSRRWHNTESAARYLGLSPATLPPWRTLKKGPRFHKIGTRVLYSEEDLDAFIEQAVRTSTSDPGPAQANGQG